MMDAAWAALEASGGGGGGGGGDGGGGEQINPMWISPPLQLGVEFRDTDTIISVPAKRYVVLLVYCKS